MGTSIRFFYLRDNRQQPVACVAVAFDKDLKQAAYGISVLNPKDRFDRNVARDIAVGRLIRNPNKVNLFCPSKDITCHLITEKIMQDLLMWDSSELPARARKAASQWLKLSRLKKDFLDGYKSGEMEIVYDTSRI